MGSRLVAMAKQEQATAFLELLKMELDWVATVPGREESILRTLLVGALLLEVLETDWEDPRHTELLGREQV
jgi:hypothetical protein